MIESSQSVLTIRSDCGVASASFAPSYGGRGTSLMLPVDGQPREMIFIRPDFWTTTRDAGGLPFLFPVCGRHILEGEMFKYRWGGQVYDMPMHGFSLRKSWVVEEHASNRLVMSLSDDEQTRSHYPFQFNVVLDYRINPNSLECCHSYENVGDQPMPFYSGFHPYFRADSLDEEEWKLEGAFKQSGKYNESFTSVNEWTPAANYLNPVDAAKVQTVLQVDPCQPITLHGMGRMLVTLVPGRIGDELQFPYLQLYRSNQDPFICLEPWMSTPNGLNEPERISILPPGEKRKATFTISV